MPMFATLLVADVDVTTSWYVDGLSFTSLFAVSGASGPALIHLRRWQCQDLLLRPAPGPVNLGSGCLLSFAAVLDELDELADRARAHGADALRDLPTRLGTPGIPRPSTRTAMSSCSRRTAG